jgi:hypothetical protein
MSNLVPFNNNGLELVIDTTTGESFASISAVARMTDKPRQYIHRYVNGALKGVTKMELKTAEIQTPGGLQGVTLLNEQQIAQVIKHYKPELLKRADELAVRVFLHGLAGYKFTSDAVVPAPEPRQLPKPTAIDYSKAAESIRQETNKTLRGLLEDYLIDELSVWRGNSPSLPEARPDHTIARYRATQLGYTPKEIGDGKALGRWVAKVVPVAFKKMVGNYDTNHYAITPELDDSIHSYFNQKRLLK